MLLLLPSHYCSRSRCQVTPFLPSFKWRVTVSRGSCTISLSTGTSWWATGKRSRSCWKPPELTGTRCGIEEHLRSSSQMVPFAQLQHVSACSRGFSPTKPQLSIPQGKTSQSSCPRLRECLHTTKGWYGFCTHLPSIAPSLQAIATTPHTSCSAAHCP